MRCRPVKEGGESHGVAGDGRRRWVSLGEPWFQKRDLEKKKKMHFLAQFPPPRLLPSQDPSPRPLPPWLLHSRLWVRFKHSNSVSYQFVTLKLLHSCHVFSVPKTSSSQLTLFWALKVWWCSNWF
ncbi:hypothetical protein L6452_02663 [Arctium lappa]|uniref:Uncharacterized protein n=1 Tax=Arctium lappa TaxID=4217 RepID=A0ACB9FL30_ARCLA|nr:hypothetical protein L6452_02663 [Arctium lappa]